MADHGGQQEVLKVFFERATTEQAARAVLGAYPELCVTEFHVGTRRCIAKAMAPSDGVEELVANLAGRDEVSFVSVGEVAYVMT